MGLYLLGAAAMLATSALADLFPDCVNGPLANNTVCDTTASVAERARALVDALNATEKISLTGNNSPGVPRLGLPSYGWWNEALHGVAGSPGVNFSTSGDFSHATSFPLPIVMGAAFDDPLINAVATVISTEARAFNNANRSGLDFWTPNINPYKDPRWGRGLETPGEDPYHLKGYVKNLIAGLQGTEDTLKIVATCKHFTAYDVENWHGNLRYQFDAIITSQELSEYYMQPFQTCARDSNVSSIMCSYNALNGVPTCADPYILQDILRDHWNWTQPGQYITSDCDAIQNVFSPHDYTSTREQAVADTLSAGTDLNCGTYYQIHLGDALSQGLFDESVLDTAVIRIYSALIRLGYFNPPSSTPYRSITWSDVSTQNSNDLALKAAEEGVVLLKNDGMLPISLPTGGQNTTIALIGSWANATTQMQGNYQGPAPYLHSPLYAAQQLPNVNILYATGQNYPTTDDWPAARDAAHKADIIILMAGITTSQESEDNDRESISWNGGQLDLLAELASFGKPTMLVQYGTMLDNTPWFNNENISAILWNGYPGQSGGDAIINIITGKTAPAGRLPVTMYPGDYVNQVAMTDMSLRPNTSSGNPGRTYMWYPNAVREFGFGMHYTNFTAAFTSPPGKNTFSIQTLLQNADLGVYRHYDLAPFFSLPINVTNTGSIASDYVALAFITGDFGPKPQPRKQLGAYERLHDIGAGESQMSSLNLTMGVLARYDEQGNQVLYPGEYSVVLDVDTRDTWNFTLTGSAATLDEWPQPRAK